MPYSPYRAALVVPRPGASAIAWLLCFFFQSAITDVRIAIAQCPIGWQQATAPPLNDTVTSLYPLPDGRVVVGGYFTSAGATSANHVAVLDGSTWTALSSGVNGVVNSVAADDMGRIYAGGSFTTVGTGAVARYIAQWDGSTWSALGSGLNGYLASPYVFALVPEGNGVQVGGRFDTAGGHESQFVTRWNGSDWLIMRSPGGWVRSFISPDGNPIVGANQFVQGGQYVYQSKIMHWYGGWWGQVGEQHIASSYALTMLTTGELVTAGLILSPAGSSYSYEGYIARWDGSTWVRIASNVDNAFNCLLPMPDGGLIAGGAFTTIGGTSVNHIARWDGTSWSPLGDGTNADVLALTRLSNGDLLVGGSFTTAGPYPASRIARYKFTVCSADFNCDETADLMDYLDFLTAFTNQADAADLNHDTVIDLFDYLDFVQGLSSGC